MIYGAGRQQARCARGDEAWFLCTNIQPPRPRSARPQAQPGSICLPVPATGDSRGGGSWAKWLRSRPPSARRRLAHVSSEPSRRNFYVEAFAQMMRLTARANTLIRLLAFSLKIGVN